MVWPSTLPDSLDCVNKVYFYCSQDDYSLQMGYDMAAGGTESVARIERPFLEGRGLVHSLALSPMQVTRGVESQGSCKTHLVLAPG